jgi:hypothetical protein
MQRLTFNRKATLDCPAPDQTAAPGLPLSASLPEDAFSAAES